MRQIIMAIRLIYRYIMPMCIRIPISLIRTKIHQLLFPVSFKIDYTSADYLKERYANRKFFIYGTGKEAKRLTKSLSKKYDISVECYLQDTPTNSRFNNKIVKSYVDLVYEEPGSFFVIIANEDENYSVSKEKFMQLGLADEIDFTFYDLYDKHEVALNFDVTLSWGRIKDKIEGFEIFGDVDNPDALKIVALGGSTTESSIHGVKGWAQYFTEIIGIPIVMYCGGISSYNSTQELLKLIRDVIPLNPDVVLSYSGVNDIYSYPITGKCDKEREKRPFINQYQAEYFGKKKSVVYYGLQNDKTASEYWIDNIRMMHAISKEFDILFLSFFQPVFLYGNYKDKASELQKIVHSRLVSRSRARVNTPGEEFNNFLINSYSEIRSMLKNYDYITDLTDIFSNDTEVVYKDVCHVTEYGNRIVAENISRVLLQRLRMEKDK